MGGAAILAAGVLPGGSVAHADDEETMVNQQVAASLEDVASLTAAEKAAQTAKVRAELRLPGATEVLNVAQGQLATAQAQQDQIAGQLKAAQSSLETTNRQLAVAQAELDKKRELIGAIARAAYSGGRMAEISAILESNGPADLVERVGLIQSLFTMNNRVIAEVADARAAFASKQATLKVTTKQVGDLEKKSSAALAKVQTIYAKAAAAQQAVTSLVAERAAAYRTLAARRAEAERAYKRLLAKQREIQARIAARGNTAGPGVPGKGGLIWPMSGQHTSGYGYRTDPFTGQQRFHAGIDIAAPSGTPIYAANTGVVMFTESPGSSGGYGNYTCIDHGGGFATCYAHQSGFAVSSGQSVTRGQLIGYEGSTGNSTGPHLHYETRVNGNPVDPQQYY